MECIREWAGRFALAALVVSSNVAAGTNSWSLFYSAVDAGPAAIDPTTSSTIFVSDTNNNGFTKRVRKSIDGGTTWNDVLFTNGPAAAIVIDPVTPSTVYVAGLLVPSGAAELYKSTDGGGTWVLRNIGLPCCVQKLVLAPSQPSTLYALAGGNRLFKSTNGAASWTLQLAHTDSLFSLAVHPSSFQTIYVGTRDAVLKSVDGGASFSVAPLAGEIMALQIDPVSPSTVYAAVDGPVKGVYRSVDAGTTWTLASNGLPDDPFHRARTIRDLAALPGSSTLFASAGCGVFKSLDGASTWIPASSGLPQNADCPVGPSTLFVSAAAPDDIWSTLRGSGFYRYTHDLSAMSPGCYLSADPTSVPTGGSTVLTAECIPAATSYIWSINSGLSSAQSSGVVFPPHRSTYTVQGLNANGTGNVASVTVDAPTGHLSGISTRALVLTGDEVMIGGFIIEGDPANVQNKTVVVRARGPSLAPGGITNPLANPTLTLVRNGSVVEINDDWGQAGNAAAIQSSGFAPSDPAESAILMSLPPAAYTAIVSGVGGGTGVGLVEVYELDKPAVPMVGISTRGKVLTGDDVMIAGFVISGDGPQTVIVRARGPSLAAGGISGALADPFLQIVSGSTVIAENDDWMQHPNALDLQSRGFAPTDDKEAAILVTLNPGLYTAIMKGVGGETGVGIVEVFEP
jgi:photosystem II stability/assembly factor-like uncharacterized protein